MAEARAHARLLLDAVLRKCKKQGTEQHTHTRIGGGGVYGGSYVVHGDDEQELYAAVKAGLTCGLSMHLTEKPDARGMPPIADLDFRWPMPERRYNTAGIRTFMRSYTKALSNYVVLPDEGMDWWLLEKPYSAREAAPPKPRDVPVDGDACADGSGVAGPSVKVYKDGVHIVCSNMVIPAKVQQQARTDWLACNPDYFRECSETPASEVFDKGVLSGGNGWLLYGSHKPENDPEPWRVTMRLVVQVCSGDDEPVSKRPLFFRQEPRDPWPQKSSYDETEMVTKLSLRCIAALAPPDHLGLPYSQLTGSGRAVMEGKPQTVKKELPFFNAAASCHAVSASVAAAATAPADHGKAAAVRTSRLDEASVAKWGPSPDPPSTPAAATVGFAACNALGGADASGGEVEEATKLVSLLSARRAHDYHTWIETGLCLHNISPTLLHLWDDWSKSSTKYEPGICAAKWAHMREPPPPRHLGVGSLRVWAREDSPDEYGAMTVDPNIVLCSGSHTAVAKIAAGVLRGRFVCTSKHGAWYKFNGTLWRLDDGLELRVELSDTVRKLFVDAATYVARGGSRASSCVSGVSTRKSESEVTCHRLNNIAFKLEDASFKDKVERELRERLMDLDFSRRLDSKLNLLAFTNGVYDLDAGLFRAARPEDWLSTSVGYDYCAKEDPDAAAAVARYWEMLHPEAGRREYVQRMFARQLYGDSGNNLFHVHSGQSGSAGNGKTESFTVLGTCLGGYVVKFAVGYLVGKRPEAGKPMPELANWKPARILYCTEPTSGETLNSGTLKELTGGEEVVYRTLYTNDVERWKPQFKLHMMCNDKPALEGGDAGNQRRTRVLEYISCFVDAADADPARHKYARDEALLRSFKESSAMKMAFVHLLLRKFERKWDFPMPAAVKDSSSEYLEENDAARAFVDEYVVEDANGCFRHSEARQLFKDSTHYNLGVYKVFKAQLERLLNTKCKTTWRMPDPTGKKGKPKKDVFVGFRLKGVLEDSSSDSGPEM